MLRSLLCFLVVLSLPMAADAQCESELAGSVTKAEARSRLGYLESVIDDNRGDMRLWRWSWFSIFAAGTVGQATLYALSDDEGKRISLVAGGTRSALGVVSMTFLVPNTDGAPRRVGDDVCAQLARAEAVAVANHRSHTRKPAWIKHSLLLSVNLANLLVLGVGFDLWKEGAIGSSIGVAVGELHILTQPDGSGDLLHAYRSGEWRGSYRKMPALSLGVFRTDDGTGIGLGGRF